MPGCVAARRQTIARFGRNQERTPFAPIIIPETAFTSAAAINSPRFRFSSTSRRSSPGTARDERDHRSRDFKEASLELFSAALSETVSDMT